MQIVVRLLNAGSATGRQVSPEVEGEHLVEELRGKIAELAAPLVEGDASLSASPAHQALYFGDQLLEDGRRLREYGVQPQSDLIVSLRPKSRMLSLCVGGTCHNTTLDTLMAIEGSQLRAAFEAVRHAVCAGGSAIEEGVPHEADVPIAQTADGTFMIDRDGLVFRYVLNFLRARRPVYHNGVKTGNSNDHVVLPDAPSELRQLCEEARYYGLPELEALAHASITQVQAGRAEQTERGAKLIIAKLGPCPAGALVCACVRTCLCRYCQQPMPTTGERRCRSFMVPRPTTHPHPYLHPRAPSLPHKYVRRADVCRRPITVYAARMGA